MVDRQPERQIEPITSWLWQENIDASVEELKAQFQSIDQDLEGNFRKKREEHLKGTFKNTAVTIYDLGKLELVLEREECPVYWEQRYIWEGKQQIATDKGYNIQTFEDYISTKPG